MDDSPLFAAMPSSAVRPIDPPTAPEGAAWADTERPISERVESLLAELTLQEKTELLYGRGVRISRPHHFWQAWVKGNDRLGIPDVTQGDSPAAPLVGPADVSQIPSEHALGASFDPDTARQAARIIGAQVRRLGYGVWHAPTLDILRDPRHGRSHENFGEDGYLSSIMGEAYARGIQDEDVVADLKHFGLNTVETDRLVTDCIVDEERVVGHYLAPFRSVLHNMDIHMVMTSYAKINGHHVNDVATWFHLLRHEWGFDGIVRNDAMAGHSLESLTLGLDQEFRDELHFGRELIEAVEAGRIDAAVVDRTVGRILSTMMRSGLHDRPATPAVWEGPTDAETDIASSAAAAGVVLMRNEGDILPLAAVAGTKIAIIGSAAIDHDIAGGPTRVLEDRDTFAASFMQRFPDADVEVVPAIDRIGVNDQLPGFDRLPTSALSTAEGTGLEANFYDAEGQLIERRFGASLSVEIAQWAMGQIGQEDQVPQGTVRAVWSGTWQTGAGEHELDVVTGGAFTLHVDDELVLEHAGSAQRAATSRSRIELVEGAHRLRAEYVAPDESLRAFVDSSSAPMKVGLRVPVATAAPGIRDAQATARAADIAIVVVRDFASEGSDRSTLRLPGQQEALITAVAAANPRTVVVLQTASAVLTPWRHDVAAIVEGWYGGSRANEGIVAVLAGDREPGGRLPVTFPERDEDLPTFDPIRFPGVDRVVVVDEDETGYRHAGRPTAARPAFPFGFGLSYTTWLLEDLRTPATVSVPASAAETAQRRERIPMSVAVTNTGERDGVCVPQLYVRAPGDAVRKLKSFRSVRVAAGTTQTVDLSVAWADLASYRNRAWSIADGDYELVAGLDSEDAALAASMEVQVR